ncbi:MAG TPA: EAL domain-containing response regulator [Wenzhouxiangellaceae bacterium]|nr:EAL domain-containing response regulator [Wenzhouxiangellaceae bacterium]
MNQKTKPQADRQRLLIVDDDELVGRTLELIARREGFDVRFTCDPDRFLDLVGEWRPSTVAIDLVMPGMDGVQVLAELARREFNESVVITSGVGHRVLDAAGRSAREHGLHIAGILPKPFTREDVRALLSRCGTAGEALDFRKRSGAPSGPSIDIDALRTALDERQFFLEYQPKVNCADGSLAGLEALVRWRHPEWGVVYPDRFIEQLEEADLMADLTRQVMDMALAWFSGLRLPEDSEPLVMLSLNMSARCLEDEVLVDRFGRRCRRHRVAPGRIIFELTETSAMRDPVRSLELLTRLRVMGFQLSIDDFGTGFSSMLQLVRLPFSEIKVDKSFVMSAEESEESRNVVRSIVELGRSLGIMTTAEGIESQWALEFLRSIGCDFCQGYFISRPVDGDAIRARWDI